MKNNPTHNPPPTACRLPLTAYRPLATLFALLFTTLTLLVAFPAIAQPPAPPPDPRFGAIESYENPAAAADLGIGWTRVRFQWAEVQASGPGTWTPTVTDATIAAELAAGREVVGLLIGIPDWARDAQRLPRGLALPHNDTGNTWGRFVREAVARYEGRITHWIIWNEPDIAATEIAHTWDGSVADFAQLQRVAYLAAKEANPDSVIHLAAFTYWADVNAGTEQYMARLLDELTAAPAAAAHHAYFDVATAHLYFQPNQLYDLLTFFTDLMRARGLEQPIWLVETNAPPATDPAWQVSEPHLLVTLPEQAAFMPQAVAVALAAGAERIAVYKLQDTEDDRVANPEPFGLVRQNGERRPAFKTYQVALQHLAGATGAVRERWDGIGQIRVDQPDRTTTVLFNRLFFEQEAAVTAVAGSALLVDMWGDTQTITATGSVYTVTLPAAPCSQPIGDYCMIGGSTFYLVQARAGGVPPALPVPLPTVTPSPIATSTATPTAPPLLPSAIPTPGITAVSSPIAPLPQVTASRMLQTVVAPTPTVSAPAAENTAAPSPDLNVVFYVLLVGCGASMIILTIWRRLRW